ncbi:RNA-binding protein 44 isoform X2 [Myripristis murdjan]|uniref:RNA-binding protein 44 isoform X2 n=1 Tax=Myripristis murdjan TaxID=586833 RepID=UPI00117633B1|nr:RNA-binding protein 44 isoform X2 [Myripristis murdjan]
MNTWPLFPLLFTNDVPVMHDTPALPFHYGCTGVLSPHQMAHSLFYGVENPGPRSLSAEECRKLLLDRSVFELVKTHQFLELTDPKLLGWYLSLPVEDRKLIQDEGGFHEFLKNHPFLEVSRHHVYVRYDRASDARSQMLMSTFINVCRRPTFYGVTVCGSCRISCPPGANWCRYCYTPIQQQLLYPQANSQKELQQPGDHRPTNQFVRQQDSVQRAHNSSCITEEPSQKKGPLSSPMWKERPACPDSRGSSSVPVCKDRAAQNSLFVDMELERHWQKGESSESRSQSAVTQGQSSYCNYSQTSHLCSEWSATEQGPPSEYYSFDSTQIEWGDASIKQSVKPEQEDSLSVTRGSSELPSTEETPGRAEGTEDSDHDYPCGCANLTYSVHDCSANTASGYEASSRSEEQSETFHSIMEDDMSILVYKITDSPGGTGVTSDSSESGLAEQSPIKISTADKSTSTHTSTCDACVGTEQNTALCISAATQTKGLLTADKHVITEVHMADLDYLTEEFIKLKAAQEELKKLKEKMSSSGSTVKKDCGAKGGCDCAQRAQQAEWSLLTLQYNMCKQHCWRLYCTSAEGEWLNLMQGDMNQYQSEGTPANLVGVLQRLESDYNEMSDKILAGVPLDQLKPLSVDSLKLTTETQYIPAQMIGDVLAKVPTGSSQQPHRQDNKVDGGNGGPCGQTGKSSKHQRREDPALQSRVVCRKPLKTVSLVLQESAAACEELNHSEAWHDALEELEPAEAAVVAETREVSTVMKKEMKHVTESAREVENTKSSFLCVTDLPSTVTEGDVMLLFEKYHASEVSISAFSNGMRVAVVTISGPQSAEAAVRELNGCSVQGHALHVEHISRPRTGSQSQALQQAPSSTSRPGSSEDDLKPQTSKTSSRNTAVKLLPQQRLHLSIEKRKVVSVLPTAKGTCVPQHYATMGGFDTLMAELTQRHPDVGRQRIVDALLELKSRHKGALNGLPLRTIMKRTSELLTKPRSTTTP